MVDEDTSSTGDGDDKRCKYCNKTVQSGVKCIKCHLWLHNSCALRVTGLKVFSGSKSLVKCPCYGQVDSGTQTDNQENRMPEPSQTSANLEIHYLKQLVEELMDKNNVLKQNNALLADKCYSLESVNMEEKTTINKPKITSYRDVLQNSVNNTRTGPAQPQRIQNFNTPIPSIEVVHHQPSTVPIVRSNSTGSASAEHCRQNYELKTLGFQGAQDSARLTKKIRKLGTGEEPRDSATKGFTGGDRRVWIYLYRVMKTATEDMITAFIKNKSGFEHLKIIVKEIVNSEDKLRSFVVVAPLDKKDDMYKTDFWPRNVGIRRFDFSRNQEFLKETKDLFP